MRIYSAVSFSDSARSGQALIDAIEVQEDVEVQYDEACDLYYMSGAGGVVSVGDIKSNPVSVVNQGMFSLNVKSKNINEPKPDTIVECGKTNEMQYKI